MSEDIERPEAETPAETPAEPQETAPPLLKEAAPSKSEPKRRGRPAGSKDTAPRKKKVVIKSEPIVPESPPEPEAAKPEAPPPPPPSPEEDPPSPRTMLRETSKHLVHLRGLVHQSRKTQVASAYTSRLLPWPV
jgi:hypothetical protein